MRLITYGKNAFNEIIHDIDLAENHILIQMFIWRDDHIGLRLLEAVDRALVRGVRVQIHKDAYGSIFEKAEENKQSLFHKEKQKGIHLLTKVIDLGYADRRKPKGYHQNNNPLLDKIKNHPNLILNTSIQKDHTKFYVIDNHILYIGGVNIEDKENGSDIQGRRYLDYMVRIDDSDEVAYFLDRFNQNKPFDQKRPIDYIMNRKTAFNVEKDLVSYLNQASQRILLHMAYFGAISAMQALTNALKRGVKVTIVTSKISNLQTEYNLYWMKRLQALGAHVLFYEGLVHAKAILVDDTFIVGSTNLNNAAFYKLGECSIVLKDQDIIDTFLSSHQLIESDCVSMQVIRYHKIKAFFEGILS